MRAHEHGCAKIRKKDSKNFTCCLISSFLGRNFQHIFDLYYFNNLVDLIQGNLESTEIL